MALYFFSHLILFYLQNYGCILCPFGILYYHQNYVCISCSFGILFCPWNCGCISCSFVMLFCAQNFGYISCPLEYFSIPEIVDAYLIPVIWLQLCLSQQSLLFPTALLGGAVECAACTFAVGGGLKYLGTGAWWLSSLWPGNQRGHVTCNSLLWPLLG